MLNHVKSIYIWIRIKQLLHFMASNHNQYIPIPSECIAKKSHINNVLISTFTKGSTSSLIPTSDFTSVSDPKTSSFSTPDSETAFKYSL